MEDENVQPEETAPVEAEAEAETAEAPSQDVADAPAEEESQDGPVDEEVPVPGTRPTDSEFAHRDSEGALIVNAD